MAESEETMKVNSENPSPEAIPSPEVAMPSQEEQEAAIKKKYGGLMPKRRPLISKDHEKAYFDSADWALGKKQGEQPGQKAKILEGLRPKLQPTPHHPLPSRRASYEAADSEDGAEHASDHTS